MEDKINQNVRVILHVDMDAFFASIEQKDNPAYRGKPVIVGADPKKGKGRGVVSTASYEARRYGIHSAMPISQAYKLCPNGIFVRPRMKRYVEESKKIMAILGEFSPLVEQVSIDEAFLDCTGTKKLFGTPMELGKKIKDKIKFETSLTASVGIALCKSVAKIASDLQKPDGLTYCPEGREIEFMYNLDIGHLWGAGKKTIELLKKSGYNKIGDIATTDVRKMIALLGRNGLVLWQLSRGIDPRPVEPKNIRKSIGKEITFQNDIDDNDYIENVIMWLVDSVALEMRKEGLKGRKVTLKIRLKDFSTYTRSKTLSSATNSSKIIREVAIDRYKKFDRKNNKVRLIGVSVSDLFFEDTINRFQNELFDSITKKRNNAADILPFEIDEDKLQNVLEEMKIKYGDKIDRAIFLKDKR